MTEWKLIPSFPFYEVSDDGQVRRVAWPITHTGNKKTGVLNQQTCARFGYLSVHLWPLEGKRTRGLINRLVCEAFHGLAPSPYHHAAHWDGNVKNNTPGNLRWATPKENSDDKEWHGTVIRGELNGTAILTKDQIAFIRKEWLRLPRSSGGVKLAPFASDGLARRFGVHKKTIYQIATGSTWKHLP